MAKKKFKIEGMSCSACSAAVEKAVSRLDGVESAQVSLLAKTMVCEYDDGRTDAGAIISAVEKAGFSAAEEAERGEASTAEQSAAKAAAPDDGFTAIKTRLAVSICFLAVLMYVSMGHMAGLPLPSFLCGVRNGVSYAFIQFLLTLPVVYVNRKFFFGGLRAFAHRAPDMDSLVAVGSSAALLYGIIAIFIMSGALGRGDIAAAERYYTNLYFESAAMILTLVTVGKYLEAKSKAKTSDALGKLVDLAPKTACVIRGGVEQTIPAEQVNAGDIVVIRPGEGIPVDGVVTEGRGYVDQSAITGESIPVEKGPGDQVISATINKNGTFRFEASKVGEDTTLAQIIRLVDEAGKVVGFLSDGDILKYLARHESSQTDGVSYIIMLETDSFRDRIRAIYDLDAMRLATKSVITVDAREHADLAFRTLPEGSGWAFIIDNSLIFVSLLSFRLWYLMHECFY